MKLADFPAIKALSTDEKLLLIDELLIAISAEEDVVSDEVRTTLDDRWARYLKDPSSSMTIDELKAKMAKVLE